MGSLSVILTQENKDKLHSYGAEFKNWLTTPTGTEEVKEHREHERFFKERLSPQAISNLTEESFREVYKTLWASRLWTNKDWYIDNKLLSPNGIEKIKQELKKLLYDNKPIDSRFDEFRKNVKGFGISSISEILNMVFAEKCCLWNEKPKTVLPFLRLNILPEEYFKYQINTGQEYLQCISALQTIKNELAESGVIDFVDLDLFFWYLFDYVIPNQIPEKPKPPRPPRIFEPEKQQLIINSHEGAEYYLLELGKMMGYYPYTVDQSKSFEDKVLGDIAIQKIIPPFAGQGLMNTVKEIDIIWFDEYENPKLCFEVEHTTDIVHGLDRLIQLQHVYAKFFIVAAEERRTKFEDLVKNRFPYRKFGNRFRFISYDELAELYLAARPFNELRNRLLGE